MIFLELFLGFLYVGSFSFGGAYSAIPLIRDVVMSNGWLTDEELTYMIAVSESTPGPIMVNLATYIGSNEAGILGSAIATLAVILPAFVIILLVMIILNKFIENKYVQAVLEGLKPCIIGIIIAIGTYMVIEKIVPTVQNPFDIRTVIITVILAAILFGSKPLMKKEISPILLIVISAALGIVLFGIF